MLIHKSNVEKGGESYHLPPLRLKSAELSLDEFVVESRAEPT
jgi:hypothetical protein